MKKSYFGIMQPLMFGARQSTPAADPAPVIDSSAIPDQILFQTGGLLEVKGAVVTGATSTRWQYSTDGEAWTALGYGTSSDLSRTADFTGSRLLRLSAVNGNSETVYSKTVSAKIAYLKVVADLNSNNGADKVTPVDDWNYIGVAGGTNPHYYSPRLFVEGVDTGRRAGATWTTSDSSLATASNVQSTGQLISNLGFASDGTTSVTLTVKYQNLQSTLVIK